MHRSWLPPLLLLLGAAHAGVPAHGGGAQVGDTALFQRYQAQNGTIARASQAVQARRFAEATRLLEACLVQVPDHFEAHYLLALMAYEGKDYPGVLGHLDVADQSLADLRRRYEAEMADLKAQAEAEEGTFRSSLDGLAARGVDPTGCSGFLYTIKKEAISYLETQKGQLHQHEGPFTTPADYHFLRGNALLRLGRRDAAAQAYRRAVAAEPGHRNAWNNLVALHLGYGDSAQARRVLAQAEAAGVALRPDLRAAVLATAPKPTP